MNCGPRQRFTVCGDDGQPFIVHNCVQRLARDIIAEHMLKIGARHRVVTMTHDEIVCCVPDRQAESCYEFMGEVMATPPVWAPGLPLDSAGGWAKNYSK